MAAASSTSPVRTERPVVRSPLFSALVGLASLGVLLQALWAGLFMGGVQTNRTTWEHVHQYGGYATTALGVIAAVVALVQLRARRDVVLGSIAFAVLLVAEVGLGSSVEDTPILRAAHFPLALLLMAVAVWLPLRARNRG